MPVAALDLVLCLESDRMGHFVGVIDQARLDEQSGVVQNEKRQREDQPYGREDELFTKATDMAGHPYSWTVPGSMKDLKAASVEGVRDWYRTCYGAVIAVLVIAGDVKADEVHPKVRNILAIFRLVPPLLKMKLLVNIP